MVWNRGAERRVRFTGTRRSLTRALAACSAADTVFVSLHDHASYMSVLAENDVAVALRGKQVIQDRHPEEAESFGAWAAAREIDVLEARSWRSRRRSPRTGR